MTVIRDRLLAVVIAVAALLGVIYFGQDEHLLFNPGNPPTEQQQQTMAAESPETRADRSSSDSLATPGHPTLSVGSTPADTTEQRPMASSNASRPLPRSRSAAGYEAPD